MADETVSYVFLKIFSMLCIKKSLRFPYFAIFFAMKWMSAPILESLQDVILMYFHNRRGFYSTIVYKSVEHSN